MNTTQDFITKEKKAELEAELATLKGEKRKEIAENLERARSMGDLSENAEYHQAREDQAYNEDRIMQIEGILRNSKIITGKSKSSSIAVGSVVVIAKKGEKTTKEVTIVGHEEVAVYTIAWQLLQFFPLIYTSVSSVMMPKASSLKTVADLRKYVFQAWRWLSVGAIVIAVLIYPSQYIIHLLFGGVYDAAMSIYLVLAYGMLLNIVSVPFSLIMNVYNRTSIIAASSIIQLIFTIVVTLIFVRWYGIMGVAYTFVFSMVTQIIWNVGWALHLLKKHQFQVV
jgi:transcription elongation factor GreA